MANCICRTCGGGFPAPIKLRGTWKCPWCASQLCRFGGEYADVEIERMVEYLGGNVDER